MDTRMPSEFSRDERRYVGTAICKIAYLWIRYHDCMCPNFAQSFGSLSSPAVCSRTGSMIGTKPVLAMRFVHSRTVISSNCLPRKYG